MIFPRSPFAVFLLCAAMLVPAGAFAAKSHPTRPATVADSDAYKGAIIMDAMTGKVLFEDNADLVNAPASMVKLMTFAVLHDKLASGAITLATPVTVNRVEARFALKKDSTSVWLKEKEVFPVEELIYAMMIQSANDAALALSRVAGGTPEAFVTLMNAKAHELGMTHSVFCSPHGLVTSSAQSDARDLTTARDYALLCRHLLLHTDVLKYTSVKDRAFGTGQRFPPTQMRNHNHLLGNIAGVDGLKTGYTIPAGFCLATTVQRNGQRLIIVTLGGTSSKSRDLKVAELIARGFAAIPPGSPAFTTQPGPTPEPSPITAAPLPQPAASPDIKFTLPPPKR